MIAAGLNVSETTGKSIYPEMTGRATLCAARPWPLTPVILGGEILRAVAGEDRHAAGAVVHDNWPQMVALNVSRGFCRDDPS